LVGRLGGEQEASTELPRGRLQDQTREHPPGRWQRAGNALDGGTLLNVFLLGAVALFVAEVAAFIAVGEHLGFGWAVLLLLAVSAVGPFIIRRVGIGVLMRTQRRLADGEVPTRELLDGIAVLFGGVLICFPGFITDAIGLLLMVRPVRQLLVRATGQRVSRRFRTISLRRWNVINVTPYSEGDERRDTGEAPREMLELGPPRDAQHATSEAPHLRDKLTA
jgi:UPF0716 protein FxsA